MKWRLASAFVFAPLPAFAHDAHVPWLPVLSLTIVTTLFIIGLTRARRWHIWRVMSFASAVISLTLLLLPPMRDWARTLFTFHMIEHEVLMALAAPLFVFARQGALLLNALPLAVRRLIGRIGASRPWRFVIEPFPATLLHGIAIWIWHVPNLFEAAIQNHALHELQHASFFLTALLFWQAMQNAVAGGVAGRAMRDLLFTALHTGAIGALMTLSPRVWYPLQAQTAAIWNLTPLEDQQLAGLVMWTPAGLIYAGAALWLMGRLLQRSRENALPSRAS